MTEKKYKNEDLRDMFSISHQTVRKYSMDFEEFLSEGANPAEAGTHRTYSESDLRVIAVIVQMKNTNHSNDEIKATLIAAAKGELSELVDDPTITLSSNMQMTLARQELQNLRNRLEMALEDAQKWRDKANKLEGLLEARPDSTELIQEIAVLKYKLKQLQDKDE